MGTATVNTAIILCGGDGSRLGAIGRNCPKCLLRVGEDSILFHHLSLYEKAGVTDVYLTLGHLASKVQEAVEARRVAVKCHFIPAKDLGTGGALIKVLCHLPEECENYWVSMGDIVCRPNLAAMRDRMRRYGARAVILGVRVQDPSNYGVLVCSKGGWLLDFREKQIQHGPALGDAGVYLFSRDFLSDFEGRMQISLEYEVFPTAQDIAVVEHPDRDQWYGVGTIPQLRKARQAITNLG